MKKRTHIRWMKALVRANQDPVGTGPCQLSPEGWYCSRNNLHPGPCALHELRPKEGTGRYYGGWGTIHGTDKLDVEVEDGEVVAVWFRCQMLPFTQHDAKGSSVGRGNPNIGIIGVELTS